jgi:hypothetical protein
MFRIAKQGTDCNDPTAWIAEVVQNRLKLPLI